MADADIWFPFFIGDYLSATSRLTTEEHGAYLLLMCDYWKSGSPPDNDAILARITRMTPDAWSIARASLEQFFSIIDGQWTHTRIDKEIEKAQNRSKAASDKARRAAGARWDGRKKGSKDAPSNASGNAPSIQQAMLEQCPSQSQSHTGIGANAPQPKSDQSEQFTAFWNAYPKDRRRGKKQAEAAFARLTAVDRDEVIRDVITRNRAANDQKWREGFSPEPHRYLKNQLWTDDWSQTDEAQQRNSERKLTPVERVIEANRKLHGV